MEEYLEFVFREANVNVVKAFKYDAIRLERLKNEPERMEEYLEFVFREANVNVVKVFKYDAIWDWDV